MTRVHLTEQQLRELEAEAEIDDTYGTEYSEHVPHPRQLTIFDALRAEDLRAYLARASV